jgi:hypothetical protein
MTFDQLWRLNLGGDSADENSVDEAKAVGLIDVPGENPNELQLTAEDCAFLSDVGITP